MFIMKLELYWSLSYILTNINKIVNLAISIYRRVYIDSGTPTPS